MKDIKIRHWIVIYQTIVFGFFVFLLLDKCFYNLKISKTYISWKLLRLLMVNNVMYGLLLLWLEQLVRGLVLLIVTAYS